jgi:hypothetical protein
MIDRNPFDSNHQIEQERIGKMILNFAAAIIKKMFERSAKVTKDGRTLITINGIIDN